MITPVGPFWKHNSKNIIFGGILTGILVVVFGIAYSIVDRQNTVTSHKDAGQVMTAQFIDGLTTDKTRIETNKGVYLVFGTFQVEKGKTLTIESRANGDNFICESDHQICKILVP